MAAVESSVVVVRGPDAPPPRRRHRRRLRRRARFPRLKRRRRRSGRRRVHHRSRGRPRRHRFPPRGSRRLFFLFLFFVRLVDTISSKWYILNTKSRRGAFCRKTPLNKALFFSEEEVVREWIKKAIQILKHLLKNKHKSFFFFSLRKAGGAKIHFFFFVSFVTLKVAAKGAFCVTNNQPLFG